MGALFWWIIFAALTVIPFWRLLPRYGFNEKLALIAIIPIGVVALLWMMAFKSEIFGPDDR